MGLFRKAQLAIWGIAAGLLVIIASGCLKSMDSTGANNNNRAFVSLLHLAPYAPSLEVYISNQKASQPILPGTFSSAYSALTPGNFPLALKKANADSVVAALPAMDYDSMKYYTILVYNDQPTSAKAVRIYDDFSVLNSNNSFYRFFHMIPNLNMDVDMYLDNVKVETGRQYADNAIFPFYNEFLPKEAGSHNIQVKKAGTDSLIYQVSTTFTERNAYSIILKGLAPASGVTGGSIDVVVLQARN